LEIFRTQGKKEEGNKPGLRTVAERKCSDSLIKMKPTFTKSGGIERGTSGKLEEESEKRNFTKNYKG